MRVVSLRKPFYRGLMLRLRSPAVFVAALAVAVGTLVAGVSCRDKRSSEPGASPSAAPSPVASVQVGAPVEARGWFVVDAGSKGSEDGGARQVGAGWWFGTDAVRTVWITGRGRRVITSSRWDGDLLHLEVDDGSYDVTRTANGLLVKLPGDDQLLKLRVATDDELRAMEKLDAQLVAKSGDVCARAIACCTAASAKKLAGEVDCAAIAATPELSRCARTLERLRKSALAANQPLPECDGAP